MGLMDEAISTARDQEEAAIAAARKRDDNDGSMIGQKLTDTYGVPFVYLRRVLDENHYYLNYRDFGGPVWRQRKNRYIIVFQVDDTLIGAVQNDRRDGWDGLVVPKTCPSCGQQRYFPLDVSRWISDPERGKQALLAGLGKAIRSDKPCTVCEAQPCPSCGRSY